MTGPAFSEVLLPAEVVREIRAHGELAYPEEACGALAGPLPGAPETSRRIELARPSENRKTEERTHRFLIPAPELRAMERELDARGLEVVGFYHSHPDHPSRPSEFDRDHAWPWYAYLVLGVEGGRAAGLEAFELDPEERVFQPRRLRELPPRGPSGRQEVS